MWTCDIPQDFRTYWFYGTTQFERAVGIKPSLRIWRKISEGAWVFGAGVVEFRDPEWIGSWQVIPQPELPPISPSAVPPALSDEAASYTPKFDPHGALSRFLLLYVGSSVVAQVIVADQITPPGVGVERDDGSDWANSSDWDEMAAAWLADWMQTPGRLPAGVFVVEGRVVGSGEDTEFDYETRGLTLEEVQRVDEAGLEGLEQLWVRPWLAVPCARCTRPLEAHNHQAAAWTCPTGEGHERRRS